MGTPQNKSLIAVAVFFSALAAVVFVGAFIWYAKTVIPHTYPTVYTSFLWGFVHGIFIVPTFVWSLFAHSVTIYQAPNDGNWYNFGFFVGISIILGSSHGARSKTPKRKNRT